MIILTLCYSMIIIILEHILFVLWKKIFLQIENIVVYFLDCRKVNDFIVDHFYKLLKYVKNKERIKDYKIKLKLER